MDEEMSKIIINIINNPIEKKFLENKIIKEVKEFLYFFTDFRVYQK